MTMIDRLSHAAAALSDEQIEGLIAYAEYLNGRAYYHSAAPEALASIDRGLADLAAGRLIDGNELQHETSRRISAARE